MALESSSARPEVWTTAALAVIGLGFAIRIVQFAHGRSLWLDEALLTLNFIHLSYLELLGELQFGQAAPIGFLIAEKAASDLFGYGERALRLVPLAAGLASLLVFARLSREFVSGLGRVVALLIVALSPPLVYYSAEVKQYSVDVLAAVVVLLLAMTVRSRPLSALILALMSIAGAAVVLISHASVFALAGAFCALAVDAAERSDWRRLGRLVVPMTLSAAGFATNYLLTRSNIEGIGAVLSGSSFYPDAISWYPRQAAQLGFYLFGDPGTWGRAVTLLAGVVAVVGTVALARQDRFKAVLVLTPIAAAMVATTLGLYPFGGRFVLFWLPVLALLIGCGIEAVGSSARNSIRSAVVPLLTASAIAGLLLAQSGPYLVSPRESQELRPVLEYVRQQWRPGDVLYLHAGSQYAARYYAEIHGVNARSGTVLWRATPAPTDDLNSLVSRSPELVVGRQTDDPRVGFEADLRMLAGRPRVWVVFSHVFRRDDGDFVGDLPAHIMLLDRAGERLDEFHQTGAAAYLLEVRDAPLQILG